MKQLFKFISASIIVSLFLVQTVGAFSVTPSRALRNLTLQPGDLITQELSIGNDYDSKFIIDVVDYYINENNTNEFLPAGETLPTGIAQWTTIDKNYAEVLGDAQPTFNVSINIPEDVKPGAYNGAIMVTQESDSTAQITVKARIATLISANIGTDNLIDKLEIVSFKINSEKQASGVLEFNTEVKNSGNSLLVPIGTIEIYDKNGKVVPNIQKLVKVIDDVEVVSGLKSEIAFNDTKTGLFPDKITELITSWPNVNVDEGEYTAKLSMFYGADSTNLTAEAPVKFAKSLHIEKFVTNDYKNSSPVLFEGNIVNNGTEKITINAQVNITNIFGQIVEIIPVAENVTLNNGEVHRLTDVEWVTGLSGLYNATLMVKYGNSSLEESVSLFIIVWWQVALLIIVVLILIFGIYKGIRGYVGMKKKLQEVESKAEPQE
ncbi:hypothetical protein ACFL10_00025 [Patescibacteria group bacterium]